MNFSRIFDDNKISGVEDLEDIILWRNRFRELRL